MFVKKVAFDSIFQIFEFSEDVVDSSMVPVPVHNSLYRSAAPNACPRPPNKLPVDDEGYLEPSPKSPVFKDNSTPTNNNAYMDLLSEPGNMFQYPPPSLFLTDHPSNYGRVPDPTLGGQNITGMPASIDNLEYIFSKPPSAKGDYHTLGM